MRLFFRCVAKALAKHGVKFAAKLLRVDAFYEFGVDVYDEMRHEANEEALRQHIAEVALLDNDEAHEQAQQAVAAVVPSASAEQQQQMVEYLSLLPGQVRQSLRRVEDPEGVTMPPEQPIQAPEDVLPFLPAKLPLFKAGEKPLVGVDLQLDELLGRGGFGEVWKARNPYLTTAEPVVLKFTTDETAIKILRNEVGVLNQVMQHGHHAGIVKLHRTYLSAEYPCLEFEYVPGFELSALIRRWHERKANDWRALHPWFIQLVDVVAFAHTAEPPIVHCDLKPANIFAHRVDKGKYRLRVLDFGIGGLATYQALCETQQPQTSHSVLMTKAARGAFTPLYASPQQKIRRRDQPPDPRDDIHALGIIWYQMLTGDLEMVTWPSDWQDELSERDVPEEVIKLLGRCVASKEQRRPENAVVLLAELKKLGGSISNAGASKGKASPKIITKPVEVAPKSFTNSIGMQFAFVPKSTFWMSENNENAQKQVEIPHDFYMGIYQVTQQQWQAIIGDNPSYFSRTGGGKDEVKDISDADLAWFPVEQVSWDDTQEFLKRLNEKEKNSGFLYRLPTEAEWEYTCRGGAVSKQECSFDFYFDQPTNDLSSHLANFNGNYPHGNGKKGPYLERTTKVGSYQPNVLGIYDMHGNVWEWCQDWYEKGSDRVVRGGCWFNYGRNCRAASRFRYTPDYRYWDYGFRLARSSVK